MKSQPSQENHLSIHRQSGRKREVLLQSKNLILFLPTGSYAPVGSHEVRLRHETEKDPSAQSPPFEPWKFEPWKVETVATHQSLAIGLLTNLPEVQDPSGTGSLSGRNTRLEFKHVPGLAPAPEAYFWQRVLYFALELALKKSYVPFIARGPDMPRHKSSAYWRPVFDNNNDIGRLMALASSMPQVCVSAICPWPQEQRPIARSLQEKRYHVESFITTVIDTIARYGTTYGAADYLPNDLENDARARNDGGKRNDAGSRNGSIAETRFFRALTSDDSIVDLGSPMKNEAFIRSLESWAGMGDSMSSSSGSGHAQSPNTVVRAQHGFRTCFRLEPPDSGMNGKDDDEEGHNPNPNGSHQWKLRFFLQATDDPSLLVPASEVWREAGETLQFLGRHWDHAQERLLTDLGAAAQIFSPLERSLNEAAPGACPLTTEEAHTYINEAAPILAQRGFGVLVPPSLSMKPEMKLKMLVRQAGASSGSDVSHSTITIDSLLDYDWRVSIGDVELDPKEFAQLVKLKIPLVRVRGQWVELDGKQLEAVRRFCKDQANNRQISLGTLIRDQLTGRFHGKQADTLSDLKTEIRAEGQLGRLFEFLRAETGEDRIIPPQLPAPSGFNGTLRPYQLRGVSWLSFLKNWGLGACLADDMGLGKTIQVIALLLSERNGSTHGAYSGQRVLLICPTSVVTNWEKEVRRFAPSLRTLVHHGPGRLHGDEFEKAAVRNDMIITTYVLAHKDVADLQRVHWRGIILDEAQNIKNADAHQSRSIRTLRAGFRIALTGTPVENHLSELWSIMEFLNPGFLGSREKFRRVFSIPIERYRNTERARVLHRLVGPFILRRVKTDPNIISDLPEKQENKVYCPLTKEQATLYQATVDEMMEQIKSSDSIRRRGLILATLSKLKQICNHPAQFMKDNSSLEGRSGKLTRLVEMLEEVLAEDNKALIFTQFATMGEMLRNYLGSVFGLDIPFLHGGVPQKKRAGLVESFQAEDGQPLLILSLKAGGTGLNLTQANTVFHFDRWWNPAVEEQATDRAFRIGQKQNVQVFKFVCLGTVEERIDQMIEDKKGLAQMVIQAGENWITELSNAELKDLFALSESALCESD